MRSEKLDQVTEGLLTMQPLIFRSLRRRLLKTVNVDINMDISPLQFEILILLEREGELNITEIGEKLLVARAQMTHLVDKLERMEMVSRRAGKDDRRTVHIGLTAQGKALLAEQSKHIKESFREILAGLTDAEMDDIVVSLNRLRDLISES